MTTAYEVMSAQFDVLALADYEAVSRRFQEGYPAFVASKKYQSVCQVVKEDVQLDALKNNLDFINAIVQRMDDESILEKSYIFLSLNPQMSI